ncbi:MAG: DegT/DnrJ/EryC1/StrS family aminotransferase [Saprospiraceae bacterium]
MTFGDIDPKAATLDLASVRALLEASPKGTYSGIVPVDFTGISQFGSIQELADEYGLWIIEDACRAPGGYLTDSKGQHQFCGNGHFAELAIFSFHPVKHIACGEGGMITTNSTELYEKLLILRTHGITRREDLMQENHGGWYYEMVELGYNYRLTDFQAALGISQLSRADEGLQRRRALAAQYDKAFEGTTITPLASDKGHAYHLYVVKIDDRKGLYDFLREHGIFAQVHYIPVHTLPYYQRLGYEKGTCPNAEAYYEECLSLPMYPTLTDAEQAFVIEKVKKFCQGNGGK